MPADKSWWGDQSAAHPDQNHIPDTVVVFWGFFLQTDLGNTGKFRDSDKRREQRPPSFKPIPSHLARSLSTLTHPARAEPETIKNLLSGKLFSA